MVCGCGDTLLELWGRMLKRALKNVPNVTNTFGPLGWSTPGTCSKHSLRSATNEESLMRDYVMGVGYR